jgi:hypothetical protein
MRHGIGWSIVFVASLGATPAWNQTSVHPKEIKASFLYSCLESPSLSVAASTPYHDGSPAVKLSLVDPKGQVQPRTTGKRTIPKSSYGEVVEMPKSQTRSRALAIEICDAVQGSYSLRVEETGGQPYRISVRGNAPNTSESRGLKHQSNIGRVWNYRFFYHVQNKEAKIEWLDENDRLLDPRVPLDMNEW